MLSTIALLLAQPSALDVSEANQLLGQKQVALDTHCLPSNQAMSMNGLADIFRQPYTATEGHVNDISNILDLTDPELAFQVNLATASTQLASLKTGQPPVSTGQPQIQP